jgi:hypothetical protein
MKLPMVYAGKFANKLEMLLCASPNLQVKEPALYRRIGLMEWIEQGLQLPYVSESSTNLRC